MATVEDILQPHTPEVRALAESLRTLVKSLVPNAREVAYPGWRGIGYHSPRSGYFCAIFPQADHVRLAFEHGVDLHDADGLLEGNGKQLRYVVVRRAADFEREAVSVLILDAAGG